MSNSKIDDTGWFNRSGMRQARRIKNMTLVALATAAEMSAPYLCNIERGHNQPSWKIAKRIAAALGLEVSQLVRAGSPLDGAKDPEQEAGGFDDGGLGSQKTLADEFAGHALAGVLAARREWCVNKNGHPDWKPTREEYRRLAAQEAYKCAEEMIAEKRKREKRK